jgi:Uma2 family endonuclease
VTTRTGLTIEQFLAGDWPPQTQLIDGEVILNDPSFRHQEISARVLEALRAWVRSANGQGYACFEGNWTLAPGQAYKPDVWWVPDDRRPGRDAVRSDVPPGIVVEVWSPGTWRYDTGRKRQIYEQAGVGELWLVDTPRSAVVILRRSSDGTAGFDVTVELAPGDALTSPQLAGFSLDVAVLFTD